MMGANHATALYARALSFQLGKETLHSDVTSWILSTLEGIGNEAYSHGGCVRNRNG
jgi:hypothetical protein